MSLVLWTLACQPTLIVEAPLAGDDTGVQAGDDTGQVDSGSGDSGPAFDTSDGPYSWSGERTYDIGGICQGTLQETGVQLTDGLERFESACGQCSQFFELSVSPNQICDLGVASRAWRGLSFAGDGTVGIWTVAETDAGELQAQMFAEADLGETVTYAWSGDIGVTYYNASGWYSLTSL
ncbi:MAG: hypothetical protein GY884_08100 [Proteobacteria bacterium]|nr:hypothetical protein [Pseudomonadota bacterium]